MREIKFKAKTMELNKWIYGMLYIHDLSNKHYIIINYNDNDVKALSLFVKQTDFYIGNMIEINPDTICQFVGIKDIKNNKIYEYDIIETEYGATGQVVWNQNKLCFDIICNEPYWAHPIHSMSGTKTIIGNKFDGD